MRQNHLFRIHENYGSSAWQKIFLKICLHWAGPRPHIQFPSRPHFVCKFCPRGENISFVRPGYPSITVLGFLDFADAKDWIPQLRHNFFYSFACFLLEPHVLDDTFLRLRMLKTKFFCRIPFCAVN
jgi:hypothetical protein